jgi:hypothetical protein
LQNRARKMVAKCKAVSLKYRTRSIFLMFVFGTDTHEGVGEYIYFIERKHYEKV